MAGNPFGVDRQFIAKELGMVGGVCPNSMDAVRWATWYSLVWHSVVWHSIALYGTWKWFVRSWLLNS